MQEVSCRRICSGFSGESVRVLQGYQYKGVPIDRVSAVVPIQVCGHYVWVSGMNADEQGVNRYVHVRECKGVGMSVYIVGCNNLVTLVPPEKRQVTSSAEASSRLFFQNPPVSSIAASYSFFKRSKPCGTFRRRRVLVSSIVCRALRPASHRDAVIYLSMLHYDTNYYYGLLL